MPSSLCPQIVGAHFIILTWDAQTRTWAVSDASRQRTQADSAGAAPPCSLIPFSLAVTLPHSSTGSHPSLLSTGDEMQHLLDKCSSPSHMAPHQPSADDEKAEQLKPAGGCLPGTTSRSSHAQLALPSRATGGMLPALSVDLVATVFAPESIALTGSPVAQRVKPSRSHLLEVQNQRAAWEPCCLYLALHVVWPMQLPMHLGGRSTQCLLQPCCPFLLSESSCLKSVIQQSYPLPALTRFSPLQAGSPARVKMLYMMICLMCCGCWRALAISSCPRLC